MNYNINRRKFIKSTAATSTALAFVPSMLFASGFKVSDKRHPQNRMTGITPISVIDNACLLAFCSGLLSQESQNSIATDIQLRDTPGNKGRLAVHLPAGNEKFYELLALVKDSRELQFPREKRAILFGWAAINAVEKNINSRLKDLSDQEFEQARWHQDALVVKGFSENYDPSSASLEEMEALLHSLLTRTITRTHTLKPDSDDGMGWVNRMTAWKKQNLVSMNAFARAILSPDIRKAGRDFYTDSDTINRVANHLQQGKFVPKEKISQATGEKSHQSQYAKTLQDAVNGIISLDKYLRGEKGLPELQSDLSSQV